jgi:hypothetical protein
MDALEAAAASANAVSYLTSRFMLDGNTYKRGAELGFAGLDFYITGRGGVLGDVDADVVAAAFAFFEPGHVRTQWEMGTAVMPAPKAAEAFAACGYTWAEQHVPDDLDASRLAELAARVAQGGRVACAPVFAEWRRLPAPDAPKAAAVHHMNSLRELRQQLHSACVLAQGLTPIEAVSVNSPAMAPLFGWADLADTAGLAEPMAAAEDATTRAIAHAYEVLTEAERAELVELANAANVATSR